MTPAAISAYISQHFEKVHIVEAEGDLFFMYDQDGKFPFATIVTRDNEYDNVSGLNREGFYRLNVGVDKDTFTSMFGALTDKKGLEAHMNLGIDFTQEDTLLPHPTYGAMYWICIVTPSDETFESLKQYLDLAYHKISKNGHDA